MGAIREIKYVKPICAIIVAEGCDSNPVMQELEGLIGPVEDQSGMFDFSKFTDYYQQEMGSGLRKWFISLDALIHPIKLIEIKLETNRIEASLKHEGKRKINLDPGYITGAKLVLASTKDYSHRLFLGKGIYGDLQLQYRQNHYHSLPWTYPDYKSQMALTFFQNVRSKYRKQELN